MVPRKRSFTLNGGFVSKAAGFLLCKLLPGTAGDRQTQWPMVKTSAHRAAMVSRYPSPS